VLLVNDEQGLDDVEQELEAKAVAPFISERSSVLEVI
jgi:hypothetical protein